MREKNILLAGEKKTISLPISLMLESYNFHITVLNKEEDLLKRIEYYKSVNEPVDLVILGSNYSDVQINSLFSSLNKSMPFLIISDVKKLNLMNSLLNKGFYGYLVSPSDTVVLIEHINTIFFNLKKYKGKSKQNEKNK